MSNYKLNTVDLYKATNGGLDIIHKYVPDSIGCETSSSKHFKFREDEKTDSSSLFNTGSHWVIKDFGDVSYDAISTVIKLTGLPFYEALQKLYSEFNIGSETTIHKANITFKENKENLPKDYFKIKEKEYKNLASYGRFVTTKIAKLYNVIEVDSYESITKKEGKLMLTESTDNYPIFCYSNNINVWAKTYKPNEYKRKDAKGKTVNFKHGYLGTKPEDYIHGLDRILKKVDETQITQIYKELYVTKTKSAREGLLEELEKLQVKNIIICSGGSDGLNAASLSDDHYPIWLNSEGAQLTYSQYQRISKLCQNFYNLPDIDKAGKKYAYSLANKYWNLKTIWLPSSKMGKNGKDFRDWLKFYSKSDKEIIAYKFNNLLKVALKCNFIDKNEQGRDRINLANFHYFLNTNNYYSYKENLTFEEKSNEDTSFLIKLEGNKVSVPESSEIREFAINYLKEQGVDLEKINLVKRSRSFSAQELKTIDRIDLDFKAYTEKNQTFYYNNGIVTVDAENVNFSTENKSNNYVWKHKVISKNFTKKESYFKYYKDKNGNNRVNILDNSCDFMSYLINGSRVHWRKEIEAPFDTVQEQENYRKNNLFTLNGAILTEQDQITQEQHFLNKCYALGYLLHRYKREDFAKFIYIMDDTVKEMDDDANGGTGKSLMIRGLEEALNIFYIDGKTDDLQKEKHVFGGLQKEHDVISIEDGKKGLGFNYFYNKVTGKIDVNPKNKQGYIIPFKDAAKFVGTFNYGISKNNGSDIRRLFFVSFGDYYHANTDNFYSERKVSDDFGYSLFQYWNDEKWNNFYNFMMQCCQLYLANIDNQFNAPQDNINTNNLKAQIGDNFMEWVADFFCDEGNFNCNLIKSELYDSYKKNTKHPLGAGRFKKAMENYCKLNGYVFNPKRFRNSQGFIKINKVEGIKRTTKECFYIQNENVTETQIDTNVDF